MPTADVQAEVRIVARVTAKAGQVEPLRAALLAMLPPSRAEPGCLLYELHEDRATPGHFVFVERWADAAAFAFHCSTSHYKALGPAIADLVAGPPVLVQLKLIG